MKWHTRTFFIVVFFFIVFKTARAQYWEPLGGGVDGGSVRALAVDTFHHYLWVGGGFGMAGDIEANHLAIWDGMKWKRLSIEPEFVNALVMKKDTLIYATGLLGDHKVGMYVDTTFIGELGSPGNDIQCLYVIKDTLYAGGTFDGRIKYWRDNEWKTVGEGIGGNFPEVNTIGEYNGELIAGGSFEFAGAVQTNNIAAWNGIEWHSLGDGVTQDGGCCADVNAVQEFNGELYVGGDFDSAGGIFCGGITKWNGLNWDTVKLYEGLYSCGDVYDFHTNDDRLYTVGLITGNENCMGFGAAYFDGLNWANLFLTQAGYTFAIVPFDDEIIVGTNYDDGYNGDTINYIAHFLGYPTPTETTEQNSSPIFPNPASTTITLSLPSNQNAILSIFSLLGEKVKEEKVTGNQVTMDVSSLPQGLYLVRTENGVVGKFLKE